MNWKVFFASATGKRHLEEALPCQDASHYRVVGDTLVGVVCDGAGSVSAGQAGAGFFARTITERIAEALGDRSWPGEAGYAARLETLIEDVREDLARQAGDQELTLADHACTLVGCIASRSGGCFFHIGDGFAIHQPVEGESVLSPPENGEYADETYFITDDHWKTHFRVTPLTAVDQGALIGLMSDGSSPFAVNRQRSGFYRPFIDPVLAYLRQATEPHGNQALHGLLASEQTCAITGDDKTLLLALCSAPQSG